MMLTPENLVWPEVLISNPKTCGIPQLLEVARLCIVVQPLIDAFGGRIVTLRTFKQMANDMEWLRAEIDSQISEEIVDSSLDPDGQIYELCLGLEEVLIVSGIELARFVHILESLSDSSHALL